LLDTPEVNIQIWCVLKDAIFSRVQDPSG
jgi:hypothetical protein